MEQYVCYCSKVSEEDIRKVIDEGAKSLEEVIRSTGAMKNSNCRVNNPKGVCCYPDLKTVYAKYSKNVNQESFSESDCGCECER